jgi:predicted ATPase
MYMRGEIGGAREAAENFLKAAEGARIPSEVAAARRSLGAALWVQGDLAQASSFLQQALELADQQCALGAGPDPIASAAAHLSLAAWISGALDRSRTLIEEAVARADRIEHVPTTTVVRYLAALREMLRGDAHASLPLAVSMIDFCRLRGVEQFLGAGTAISAWARARHEGHDLGLAEFRQSLAELSGQGHRLYLPFYLGRLAEIELSVHRPDLALATATEARKLAQDTGQRVFDGFLERLRGEALLAVDRANAPAAEAAFHSAVELSGRQGARSFGLQAALPLARLYQSTSGLTDAHNVLAQALEGFSTTSEMPEIGEAQALLATLAETAEVKSAVAQRQRRGGCKSPMATR